MSTVSHVPDFHVNSLSYSLCESERVTFVGPPAPVEFETSEASFRLENGKLTCKMKQHFEKPEEARSVVEPTIRAWEVDSDLRGNRNSLRFKFESADVIDRAPCPPGVLFGYAHITVGARVLASVGTFTVHVESNEYPEPPRTFRLNPEVESMLHRYNGYLDGREPLLSMAYFCLTVIEATMPRGNRRQDAANHYRIGVDVLNKVGDLSSERGDHSSARKAYALQPLSGKEQNWLEHTIKILIRRLGDTRNLATLPEITMSDLPQL